MARARRRPRRPRDREHRQRAKRSRPASTSPQLSPRQGRRCASSRAAPATPSCAFTAWHNQVWKPVIAAVNGSVRRRRAPLRRRRRHRDRGGRRRRSSTRTCRSGRSIVVRGRRARRTRSRSNRSCAWRWSVGTSACRRRGPYQLGMISQVVDPPEGLARRGAGAGRDDRQELARRDARATKKALWGALEHGSHRRVPRRCAGARRHVGPPRPDRRPARVRGEARAPEWETEHVDASLKFRVRLPDVERHGPVGLADQQPARAAQRDEQPACATSSPTRGSSSTPIPRSG